MQNVSTTTATTTRERKRIAVQDVRAVLEQIAAECPQRRDRRAEDGLPARYIDKGKPNCLVAIVLLRLGFRSTILRALDEEYPVGELFHAGARVQESRHPALKKIAPSARALLQYVQDAQDNGLPWGTIIKSAFSTNPFLLPRFNRARKPWLYPETS
jgi:hypothetical protein